MQGNFMRLLIIGIICALFISLSAGYAQDTLKVSAPKQQKHQHKNQNKWKANGGRGFVDANGDGYNDNAPDDDGDGIPNGLDPDFQRGQGFVDLDGDGINDLLMDDDGDGIPNGKDADFLKSHGFQKGKAGTTGTGAANGSLDGGKGAGKPQYRGGRK